MRGGQQHLSYAQNNIGSYSCVSRMVIKMENKLFFPQALSFKDIHTVN